MFTVCLYIAKEVLPVIISENKKSLRVSLYKNSIFETGSSRLSELSFPYLTFVLAGHGGPLKRVRPLSHFVICVRKVSFAKTKNTNSPCDD